MNLHKSGDIRILGYTAKNPVAVVPDVKTLPAQGYDVDIQLSRAFVAPAGMPKEYVEVLDNAIKKMFTMDEFKKKAEDAGMLPYYMNTADFNTHWNDLDSKSAPLIELAKADTKKPTLRSSHLHRGTDGFCPCPALLPPTPPRESRRVCARGRHPTIMFRLAVGRPR